MSKRAAEHHQRASEHLARAAQHHRKAAQYHEAGSDEAAIQHTHAARSHTARAADHAEKALKAYVEHIQLLMGEIRHRAKNTLNLVQAIARQTATGEPETFITRFNARIQALASNQDLMVRSEWQGVCVEDLARAHLAFLTDQIGSRIVTHDGAGVRLTAAAAQVIGLALHELATNAVKYGALSTSGGHVDLGWEVDRDRFTMSWIEKEGPLVKKPERQSFGTTVITSLPKLTIDAEAQLDFAPSGVVWRLTCPARNVLLSQDDSAAREKQK